MNNSKIAVALGLLVVVAFFIGLKFGAAQGEIRIIIDEFKVAVSNYHLMNESNQPILAEFAKARYYYYANRLPNEFFPFQGDYGPVNSDLINGLIVGKNSRTFEEEYELFKNRKEKLPD